MPWALGLPPQNRERQQRTVMQNAFGDVKESLVVIGEEKSLNPTLSLPYTKPSLMHRLSHREQEITFPSRSDSTLRCSTELIDRLSEPTRETLRPRARQCPKRAWEEVGEPLGMKGTEKRKLLDRMSLDVSRFPWTEHREVQVATLPEDIRTTLSNGNILTFLEIPNQKGHL